MFPFPPMVWRFLLVLLSLYVIVVEKSNRLPCEKFVLLFVIINLVHFVVSYTWQNPSIGQIWNVFCALLPLSLFLFLSQKGVMNDRFFTYAGIILLMAAILHYYHVERTLLIKLSADEDADVTNNASVAFLMLLPMLFFMKNNVQKWATLMICLFYILLSAKRGNILAAVIPTGLFVFSMLKDSRQSVLKTVIVLVIIVGGALMVNHWVETNDFLLLRIERAKEGSSSGRDVIYRAAWDAWSDSDNIITLLLGYGTDATTHLSSTGYHRAHNDWLECLVDYGLIGALFYLMIFISLVVQIREVKSYHLKMALLASFFIWFFKSLYSMGFTDESLSICMISMGTALGKFKLEKGIL
jgi:O-antigen ligase